MRSVKTIPVVSPVVEKTSPIYPDDWITASAYYRIEAGGGAPGVELALWLVAVALVFSWFT